MRDISNLKGKIFRHFKGDLYLVEDFVKHSEKLKKPWFFIEPYMERSWAFCKTL